MPAWSACSGSPTPTCWSSHPFRAPRLLMLTGSTADRIGRKRLFMTGLAGFTLGSLLCSLAPTTGALIALRMLQGLGGSMLTPISLSIVRNVFTDERERTQAIGIWSGIFGVATACGPIAGGILVSTLGWRSVFWLNVPGGIAMLLAARRYVPESKAPSRAGSMCLASC